MRPSERWLCGLPPTASITEKMSHRSSRRSSPSHEPLAIGEGEEAFSSPYPNRMDVRMARTGRIAGSRGLAGPTTRSPFMTARRLPRTARTDCEEDRLTSRGPIAALSWMRGQGPSRRVYSQLDRIRVAGDPPNHTGTSDNSEGPRRPQTRNHEHRLPAQRLGYGHDL